MGGFNGRRLYLSSRSSKYLRATRTKSASVTIPTTLPSSITGRHPILRISMRWAASAAGAPGQVVTTSPSIVPISRRFPLAKVTEAHAMGEKPGAYGKFAPRDVTTYAPRGAAAAGAPRPHPRSRARGLSGGRGRGRARGRSHVRGHGRDRPNLLAGDRKHSRG